MGSAQRIGDIIDNDNGRFLKKPSMTMSMKEVARLNSIIRSEPLDEDTVELRADDLVERLNSPNSRPLFCLIARWLTDGHIEWALKMSSGKDVVNPGGLFNKLCYRYAKKAANQYRESHGSI